MTLTRNEARDTLHGLRALGTATPRQIKRIGYGLRVPYIRAALTTLETTGATARTSSPDTWTTGPRFDEVFAAADWCEDDGTPQPKWEV